MGVKKIYQDEEQDVDENHYNLLNLKEGMIFEHRFPPYKQFHERVLYFFIYKIENKKIYIITLELSYNYRSGKPYILFSCAHKNEEQVKIDLEKFKQIENILKAFQIIKGTFPIYIKESNLEMLLHVKTATGEFLSLEPLEDFIKLCDYEKEYEKEVQWNWEEMKWE